MIFREKIGLDMKKIITLSLVFLLSNSFASSIKCTVNTDSFVEMVYKAGKSTPLKSLSVTVDITTKENLKFDLKVSKQDNISKFIVSYDEVKNTLSNEYYVGDEQSYGNYILNEFDSKYKRNSSLSFLLGVNSKELDKALNLENVKDVIGQTSFVITYPLNKDFKEQVASTRKEDIFVEIHSSEKKLGSFLLLNDIAFGCQ